MAITPLLHFQYLSISPIPSVTPGDFFCARYRGVQQRVLCHRFNHRAAIVGGRPNIADRLAFLGRYGGCFHGEFLGKRLAFEQRFGSACSNRRRRDGPENDSNNAAAFVGGDNIGNRNPDVSQIHHVARRELDVLTDELWTRLRDNDFGEDFIWAHNGLARPTKKFLQATILSPPALTIFAVAFKAIILGATSADGVALAILPPTVARFLIWIDPTSAALWQRNGYFLFRSESISMSRIVVNAPIVMLPSVFSRIPERPGTLLRSTTYVGISPFSLMAITRSVPPARKRPPAPLSLNRRLASRKVVG